jgi:predicted N-acetyltransferase YhbS
VVALAGPCLVGIVYYEWLQFKRAEIFWGYKLSFVDVHESWRENGIGSTLVKHLNSEPWLKGRNLCLTSYTELGEARIAHVIDRELTSTDVTMQHPWH